MPLLQSMYPIIDKISPFYNLMENYLSIFAKKKQEKNVILYNATCKYTEIFFRVLHNGLPATVLS
jgi:hypothetical protein